MNRKWKVASSSSSSSSSSHHLPLMESNSSSLIISLELSSFLFFFFLLLSSSLLMTSQARTLLLSTSDSDVMTTAAAAAALLAFKNSSITSDPIGFLSDWSSSAAAPCSWRGVFCSFDAAMITSLNLSGAGLVGRIDLSHLISLPTLTSLHLAGNFFSGDFSSSNNITVQCSVETIDLSSNNFSEPISKNSVFIPCRNLHHLNLSNNHLTGTFSIGDNMFQSLQLLDLSRNNITANFSTFSFGTCRNLTTINLSHNGLFGNQFPDSLTNCQLLDSLNLGYNALGPTIPGISLSRLKKLKKLDLGRNSFTGQIPPELGQTCGSLEVLDLCRNALTGQLPYSFSSCSSLISLNLGNNQLSGDFLRTVISSLPSLRYLYLPFNNLSGSVPVSIANNSRIQVLDLSSNSLTGTIPAEFCSSSAALERLLMPNNYLTGNLPAELGKCSNLRAIDFSFNYLVGEIPSDIWKLPNLSDLVLWANSLTGEIPEGICNNGDSNFQTLILNNNLITGTIPFSITNCTKLMWVSLSNNRLTGEIPTGIGNLLNLAILQLGNNSLTGGIPPELGNCKSLIWLDLNSNALTGAVPSELANQSGLIVPGIVSGKDFVFVRNEGGTECRGAGGLIEFEGIRAERLDSFPMMHSCSTTRIYSGVTVYTFAHNGSMIYLDLSYNSLSGDIPDKFGSMMFLQVLNMGHNNLSGVIPSGLGNLKAAGVLDLSHNNLHGFIPPSLGGLSFLSDLDFSNNNLSGMIPSGGQLTTFPSSRYENNSGLCGVPLPPCKGSESGHPNSSSSHRNNKTVTAEMGIGIGFSIFCIFVLFFALYRIKKNQKKEVKIEKYIDSLQTSGSSSWKLSSVHEPLSINVSTFDQIQKPLIRKLTFAHLLEATNGFSPDSLIGSGGFGEVYRAQLRDGTVVAIKKLIHVTGQGDREFMAEMETIGKIKHRNLVPLLGYCKIGEERLLVYEYMKWGSLESVLQDKSLNWITRKKIAIGSARGLAFLHHSCIPHIIHRDMKSSNVLLDEDFEARVSDFGMARLVNAVEDTHLSVSTLAGTPGYVPPEYYQSFRCTAKGDVYSFGVVLLELISGKRPIDPVQFGDDNNLVGWAKQLQREKKSREILDRELVSDSNEEELLHYLKVAFECLEDRPYRRPTMIQVMAMFKELQQVDSVAEGDILHGMSLKNAVIDESQEK